MGRGPGSEHCQRLALERSGTMSTDALWRTQGPEHKQSFTKWCQGTGTAVIKPRGKSVMVSRNWQVTISQTSLTLNFTSLGKPSLGLPLRFCAPQLSLLTLYGYLPCLGLLILCLPYFIRLSIFGKAVVPGPGTKDTQKILVV